MRKCWFPQMSLCFKGSTEYIKFSKLTLIIIINYVFLFNINMCLVLLSLQKKRQIPHSIQRRISNNTLNFL